ncbi:MAG: S8 family serine peptidase [Burkholderiaceae bacterium]
MGVTKNRADRLYRILLGGALAAAVGLAWATPPIVHAPTDQSSAQPELIEQIVIYRRSLSVLDVKPTSGLIAPAEPDDAKRAGATALASLNPTPYSRFENPVRLSLPFPMTEAQAYAWAAQQMNPDEIEGVLIDRAVRSHGTVSSNDSLAYTLWNLAAGSPGTTQTEPVWPQYRGSGVTVAVLDTGKVDHPDMQGVWNGGYDFIVDPSKSGDGDGRDADPTDTMTCVLNGSQQTVIPHGLHVASIIAARLNNNEGLAGVAPLASIMPLRVISGCGGVLSDVLDAMRWAVGLPVSGLPTNPNPVKILNLSLGTTSPGATCNSVTQAVVDEVLATGAAIIVSTGNDGADSITVPAACNGVIAVAAATKDGQRADYSNAGAGTTLAAAGGGCAVGAASGCSTDPYNFVAIAHHDSSTAGYRMGAGTSYAAPHVAGAAALLLEQDSGRTGAQIKSLLADSTRAFIGSSCNGGLCGTGQLDVEAALVPPPFTVSASAQAGSMRAGDTGTLQATVSSGAISPSYVWQQLAGTSVTLTPANGGQSASFIAPQTNEVLSFRVTVTDATSAVKHADVGVTVSVPPALATIDPIQLEVGASLRQPMTLAGGGSPMAIAVDTASIAQGVQVDGAEVVWNQPPSGDHTVEVTPYDAVGSGVPFDMQVKVATAATQNSVDTATQNPMSGGGGLIGWHGAVLLLLAAGLLAPSRFALGVMLPSAGRSRRHDRAMRAATELAALFGFLALATAAMGAFAPAVSYGRHSAAAMAWLASFAHIDLSHLLSNLIGLALVQVVFARAIDARAWAVAVLVAAPAAHMFAVGLGLHSWVAGLSTALHALAAWAIGIYWVDDRIRGQSLGPVLATGLVVKLVLDGALQARWPEVGAQASVTLHASAAAIGLLGGVMIGHRRIAQAMSGPLAGSMSAAQGVR